MRRFWRYSFFNQFLDDLTQALPHEPPSLAGRTGVPERSCKPSGKAEGEVQTNQRAVLSQAPTQLAAHVLYEFSPGREVFAFHTGRSAVHSRHAHQTLSLPLFGVELALQSIIT
jgi:hypothetical protein